MAPSNSAQTPSVFHSMENNSGDKFSFPTTPNEEGVGFEFGCNLTPDPPKSPADHLFFNGKLQPHSFPNQPPNPNFLHFSRSTSRSSRNGSMESLLSSRSNSSRSGSGCSSARTSISEPGGGVERKLSVSHQAKVVAAGRKNSLTRGDPFWNHYQAKKPTLTPHFSSSRRWQFITPAPGPALRSQSSRRMTGQRGWRTSKENKDSAGAWFEWRFLKRFVSACLSCHAINSIADEV